MNVFGQSNGPDGALYVVDLYRGILQHRVFLTSYLRRQIEERGLDKGIGLGRIWRITHEDGERTTDRPLSELAPHELIAALGSPNGWRRSAAQKLLLEAGQQALLSAWKGPSNIAPGLASDSPEAGRADFLWRTYPNSFQALRSLFLEGSDFERLHAGWTLAGLDMAEDGDLEAALRNTKSSHLLAQWVRLSEGARSAGHIAAWDLLASKSQATFDQRDASLVFWQLAQSLGERPPTDNLGDPALSAHSDDPLALAPTLLRGREADPILREGLLSGLARRELDLLEWLCPSSPEQPHESSTFAFPRTVEDIGRIVAKRADWQEYERLFEFANSLFESNPKLERPGAVPLLRGFARALTQRAPEPFPSTKPIGLARLLVHPSDPLRALAIEIDSKLVFDGSKTAADDAESADYSAALIRGEAVYQISCIACHQTDGRGIEGLAPPLGDPAWLGRSDKELIKIVLEGLSGEIQVEGKTWNLLMPPWAHLGDEQIADVLTYVLWTFGADTKNPRSISAAAVQTERP